MVVLQALTTVGTVWFEAATILSVIWLASRFFTSHQRKLKKKLAIEAVADKHGCSSPVVSATASLINSLWHKVSLVKSTKGDFFNDYSRGKFQKYGPTHVVMGSNGILKSVQTIDPQNLNTVLVSDPEHYTVFTGRRNALAPLAQDGVLTTDGHEWRSNRKLVFRFINNSTRVRDTTADDPDVELLFQAIGEVDNTGWTPELVDMTDLIRRLAHDMSTKYLFGSNADFQLSGIRARENPDERPSEAAQIMNEYIKAFEVARDYVTWRGALGTMYWLADGRTYRNACKKFEDMADLLVSRAAIRKAENPYGEDFVIDMLIADLQDPIKVRKNVIELTIAGQNMTGTILEWTIAQLADHPDVYARLREEVLNKFGSESEDSTSQMVWKKLNECPTLQNVLSETMRLHPLVATLGRTAVRDTVLPRGGGLDGKAPIVVPKGAAFTTNIYLLHRRKEEWGEDAEEWKPDRWIGRRPGSEYAPFGAGPRICIGRQLSLTEMSFVLARFVQRFSDIRAPDPKRNLEHQYRATLSPKHGVKVLLKQAM